MDSDEVEKSVETFINEKSNDRYNSWELCYNEFLKFKNLYPKEKEIEHLSLHLMGYLASWGMYRGSSALLRDYSYMVHKELIPILLKEENCKLFSLNVIENTEGFLRLLYKVYDEIKGYYEKLENNEGKRMKPSHTLITKILLGVYGCIPAYDRNVVSALRKLNIKSNKFEALIEYIKSNESLITQFKSCSKRFPQYTFMKIVDIYLWKTGSNIN